MEKKTIFILLSVIVIIGFAGFLYYRGAIFSKEILKLEILGSNSAKVGDEVSYTVIYKNNGNFVLENPKLVFELPDNSLTEDGKTRFTRDLRDIYPGSEDFIKFSGRLLGKEGDLKVARVWLSYVPHNLSVRYESDTTFTTKIDMVPITLSFDLPSKAEKGKEVVYVINYFSNIEYPLENLSIKVDPTDGFNSKSSDPSSLDDAEWRLDVLHKGQGGKVKIRGVVSGNMQDRLSFYARIGMWQDGSFVVIKEANQDVQVIQPLLVISQHINGSASYVASPGENLHYEIFLRNTGYSSFDNLLVTSKLDGSALDFSTLQSQDGQLRASDNSIVFDPNQITRLQHISSQQEVKVDFTIKLKGDWVPFDSEKNNLFIKHTVNALNISQEFDTKISSKLGLSQKAYYLHEAGIENSGPIPPEVGRTTMYTVTWQVKNYFNDVKNIKVKAVLPKEVTLNDYIFPEDQASHFSLDSKSREIFWSAGDLSTGSSTSLIFQVALTPSALQKGQVANIIGQAIISGEDQVTGAVIQSSVAGVNTSLPDDQSNSGGGIVQ